MTNAALMDGMSEFLQVLAYVAAEVHAVEVDVGQRSVGLCYRRCYAVAVGCDGEYATTGCDSVGSSVL